MSSVLGVSRAAVRVGLLNTDTATAAALPPTKSTLISHGSRCARACWSGCDANDRNTNVSKKKWASGTFTSLSAGKSSTIQKNEQISTERNPRTEPEGNPNVGYS